MPYTTRQMLDAILPASQVVEALDDNEDGQEDAGLFDSLLAAATDKTNSYLQGRYDTAFHLTPDPPALLKTATLYFLAESLFTRRPGADAPPKIAKQAKEAHDRLTEIHSGKLKLHASKAEGEIVIVAEPPAQTLNS